MNNFKTSKKLLALLLAVIMTFSGISVYAAESVGTDEDYGISLAHDHFYSNWEITKQPTCKTSGIKTRKCLFEGCGKTETVTVDPVVNAHVPGTETVIRAVTCTTNGISEFVCSSCGEEYRVETKKLGHVFPKDSNGKEIWTVTIEPGHMKKYYKNGSAHTTCARCNLNVNKVVPVEHDFDGVKSTVVQPSTCTTEGYKETVCKICEYSIREALPIDETAHVFSGKINITSEVFNCKTDGKGIVICEECNVIAEVDVPKELYHKYYVKWEVPSGSELPAGATCSNNLTGEEVRFCRTCKTTLEERYIKADHKFEKYDENGELVSTVYSIVEPTCFSRGYYLGNCVECGAKDVKNYIPADPDAHDYLEVVKESATCASEGALFRMCRYDGSHYDEIAIEKLPHIYSDAWEIKEATCQDDGYKKNHCAACNEPVEIILPQSESAHVLDGVKWTVHRESDCATDLDPECGEERAACKLCRKPVSRELPLCYNSTSLFIEHVDPTCYRDGEDVYACRKCGTEISIPISKDTKAHVPSVGYVLGKDSTCKEVGYKTHVCIYCDAEIDEDQIIIPLKEHVIVEEYDLYPTCNPDPDKFTTGVKHHKCTVCDYVSEDRIINAEHNFSTWTEPVNASCLAPVKRERVCYNCNLVEVDNLYYGPHTEGNWTFISGSCKVGGIVVKTCRTCKQNYDTKAVKAGEHADLVLVSENLVPTNVICYGNEYKCNVCDETVVTTNAHNFIVVEKGFAPTCELPGLSDSKYCARCKYKMEQTVLAPLGHSFYYDSEGTKACSVCKRYFVEGALQESCKHFCHNNGMVAKVMKIVFGFFWKTFGSKHFCECGTPHYHEDAVTIVSTEYDDEGNLKKLEYSCSECKGLTKTKTIKF